MQSRRLQINLNQGCTTTYVTVVYLVDLNKRRRYSFDIIWYGCSLRSFGQCMQIITWCIFSITVYAYEKSFTVCFGTLKNNLYFIFT